MEQSQFESTNHSDSFFRFSPHRRRHLKSETFCTLVRILSHFYGESQLSHCHKVVSMEPKRGSGENELGQATEPEVRGEPVGPTGVEFEILLIQSDARNSKVYGVDECVKEGRMEIDEFDHVNRINMKLFRKNGIEVGNTLDDKNLSGNVVSLIDNQERQCSVQEICMEESGNVRQLVVDKEHQNCEATKALDLSLDIDMIAESPKLDENNAGSSFVEKNVLEEVGHEMQTMELEKSVSNYVAMNSSPCVTADEEIEEGEILGNIGLYEQSIDLLPEDAVLLENKKLDKEQTFEAIINKEQLTCKKQKGASQEDTKPRKNFVETIDNVNGVDLKLRENIMLEMECKSEMVVCGKNGEAKMAHGYDSVLETGRNKKQGTRANEEFNHPAVPAKIIGENATRNHGTLSTGKGSGVHKKRKRSPSAEEKGAKKKQKDRIKRDEKNRQLGVKRLKIQPVLKPKTVAYCRQYLNGRCLKGEKCKFSHDAVPLTKSKPCCHFARHSCMKGDGCPFDHQLSKYPCNNYLSNGYCSRGTDCMFSHERPLMEGSPSAVSVSKPQLKPSSLLRGTNSEKQLNLHNSSHQKVDSKSGSVATSSWKNAERKVAESLVKPSVQTPKGISKVLFGKSSLGNPSKINQDGSSPKADGGVKVGPSIIHSTPDMARNSNEITRMTAVAESKGINFPSFGKAPLHDYNGKKPSSLPLSRDCGILISTFSDSSKDKQASLPPKKDEGLKVGNQTGQRARDMVHNSSETPKRTPAMAPRGINFLSFGKAPLDDSSNMKLASVPPNGHNDVVSSSQERESAPKLQIPSAKPWRLLSSSLPSDQAIDGLADERSKNTPSSALQALLTNTPNSTQKAHLSNMPNSAQKALLSTLAFAAKYKSGIKMDRPAFSADFNKESSNSQNTSRGSTILDFLYSNGSKTKQ